MALSRYGELLGVLSGGPEIAYERAAAVFENALRDAGSRTRRETRNVVLEERPPRWFLVHQHPYMPIRASGDAAREALLSGLGVLEGRAAEAMETLRAVVPSVAIRGVA